MTMLQIPLDEPLASVLRKQAAAEGKSLEAWAVEAMKRLAAPTDSVDWLDEYVSVARQARGNSRGWKWNREELYDE
jgi:plasmid stability protein